MYRKIGILGIMCILWLFGTASAGVELNVADMGTEVVEQGGKITYIVTVTGEDDPENAFQITEVFSISDDTRQSGWVYTFDPSSVALSTELGNSASSTLTMTVADNTPEGITLHKVEATGDDGIFVDADFDIYIVNPDVMPSAPVPELNTVILTSLGMLGLFVVSRIYN